MVESSNVQHLYLHYQKYRKINSSCFKPRSVCMFLQKNSVIIFLVARKHETHNSLSPRIESVHCYKRPQKNGLLGMQAHTQAHNNFNHLKI